jgi:phosphatidylserine/phosphatidylglycerophosphate/cardiolipin synthase-like enzyme
MAIDWSTKFTAAKKSDPVEFLIKGPEYYERVLKDISTLSSGDCIYIMGWMLEANMLITSSSPHTTLIDVLIDASDNRGVEVRLLIWDNPSNISTNGISKADLDLLVGKGIEIMFIEMSDFAIKGTSLTNNLTVHAKKISDAITYITNSGIGATVNSLLPQLNEKKIQIDHFLYDPILSTPLSKPPVFVPRKSISICSYHDKVTILIKNKEVIAYCGGIDYNSNRMINYHDVQCRVKGPAAEDIYSKFIKRWKEHPVTGKSATFPVFTPYTYILGTRYLYALAVGNENYTKPIPNFHRTLKKAYSEIIKNAEKYIYIEDQYMVNVDVAKELNSKIRVSSKDFKLILLIQCDAVTPEMLIPARKRQEFIAALEKGLSSVEKAQIHKFTIDPNKVTGNNAAIIHSKIMIADDEIAIIGSSNVNRRSFTYDSETSLVIFDEVNVTNTFAKDFRIRLWTDHADGSLALTDIEDVSLFVNKIVNPSSKIGKYTPVPSYDFDQKVTIAYNSLATTAKSAILSSPLAMAAVVALAASTAGSTLTPLSNVVTSLLLLNSKFCDSLFDELIDPKA